MKNIFSKNSAINDIDIIREDLSNCDSCFYKMTDTILSIMNKMNSVEIVAKANGMDDELELEIRSFNESCRELSSSILSMRKDFENIENISINIQDMCEKKIPNDALEKEENNMSHPFNDDNIPF